MAFRCFCVGRSLSVGVGRDGSESRGDTQRDAGITPYGYVKNACTFRIG
jgi:hypothetical protein